MAESTDYEEHLHKLLEREMEAKDSGAVECRIRNAKFPCKKYLEDLDTGCMPKDLQSKPQGYHHHY